MGVRRIRAGSVFRWRPHRRERAKSVEIERVETVISKARDKRTSFPVKKKVKKKKRDKKGALEREKEGERETRVRERKGEKVRDLQVRETTAALSHCKRGHRNRTASKRGVPNYGLLPCTSASCFFLGGRGAVPDLLVFERTPTLFICVCMFL